MQAYDIDTSQIYSEISIYSSFNNISYILEKFEMMLTDIQLDTLLIL